MTTSEAPRATPRAGGWGPGDATVLVVDDSPIDRRLAGALVEKAVGLRAAYAADGGEALEQIARAAPAIVLTDMQMPEMDGLELVEEIRRRHPSIPVVLMTAFGSEEVAIQALKAGAAHYVPKKMLARDLVETIRQILSVSAVDRRRLRLLRSVERRETALCLDNDPELIGPLINLLQDDLGGMDLGDETARLRVGVALQEALANAIYHGNLEVSSELRQDNERVFYDLAERRRGEEPYGSRRIFVESRLTRDQAEFVVRDEGPGFDTERANRPIEPEDLMKVGGRGLLLIRTFMDEVRHNREGNMVTLVKRCRPPAGVPACT